MLRRFAASSRRQRRSRACCAARDSKLLSPLQARSRSARRVASCGSERPWPQPASRRRDSIRRSRRCADRRSAGHRAEAHGERAGRAVLGQRVRQQARAAAPCDDDPRLRRLHSRLERQQRRRSGPDDDHVARHRARGSGRRRRLLRRRHAARIELQLRRRARVRARSHALRRRAHRSAARPAGHAVRRRRDGRLAQICAAPTERERLRGVGRRRNVRHLVGCRLRLGRACRRERAARRGSCRAVGQLLRTADAGLRGQRSHRRAGRERRRPARRTSRVAVADQ